MEYLEYPPQPALRDYIVCFWSMTVSPLHRAKSYNHRVLPDCCSDIIFDFTGARGRSPAYVVGTMTRPILFTTDGVVDMLGIRFKPGASRPFLQVSIQECTDLAVDLDSFWGSKGSQLWYRLAELHDSRARISLIEDHLLRNYQWNRTLDPYVQYCVRAIEKRSGRITTKALEIGTGLSSRQIERKFNRDIGVGPKAYSRIVRFLRIIRQASSASAPDWSTIALNLGYSDQAHLVREFREFSGITPTEFVAEQ